MKQLLFNLQYYFCRLGRSALFGYASIMALQIKILWNTWDYWDLQFWDGVFYFKSGQVVANSFKFPSLDFSPLFAGYYAIFHILLENAGPFAIYFGHRFIAILLVNILFYTFLRSTLSPTMAWLLGVYVIQLEVGLNDDFVVHLFVLIPLLGAYLASLYKSIYSNGLILACLLLASLVRPEFVLSFAVAFVILIFNSYISNKGRKLGLGHYLYVYVPLIVAITIVLVILLRAGSISSGRSWLAFGQHYAWGYQERHPEWDEEFWLKWEEATQRSFSDAKSLPEAVFNNPPEFVTHILWNLRLASGAVNLTLKPLLLWFETYLKILFGLSVAITLIMTIFARRNFGKIWYETLQLKLVKQYKLWLVMLSVLLASVVSALLIRPRPLYLLTLLPLIFLVIGLSLEVSLKSLGAFISQQHATNKSALYNDVVFRQDKWLPSMLPLVFVILLIIFPTPFTNPPQRPAMAVAESIGRFSIEEHYGLLAEHAEAFCLYSASELCQSVNIEEVPAHEPFIDFLEKRNVQVIVMNERLVYRLPLEGQEYMVKLYTNPGQVGWQEFDHVVGYKIYTRNR